MTLKMNKWEVKYLLPMIENNINNLYRKIRIEGALK